MLFTVSMNSLIYQFKKKTFPRRTPCRVNYGVLWAIVLSLCQQARSIWHGGDDTIGWWWWHNGDGVIFHSMMVITRWWRHKTITQCNIAKSSLCHVLSPSRHSHHAIVSSPSCHCTITIVSLYHHHRVIVPSPSCHYTITIVSSSSISCCRTTVTLGILIDKAIALALTEHCRLTFDN